jgi:hypothetical protein
MAVENRRDALSRSYFLYKGHCKIVVRVNEVDRFLFETRRRDRAL